MKTKEYYLILVKNPDNNKYDILYRNNLYDLICFMKKNYSSYSQAKKALNRSLWKNDKNVKIIKIK